MKKNENVSISLQIQREKETNGMILGVKFNKDAPNFLLENDNITWYPTGDEIDFITDAFQLIEGSREKAKTAQEPASPVRHTEENSSTEPSEHPSEIRIPPLPDDPIIDIGNSSETVQPKNDEIDEKIFVQADDKKIDEVLRRKRPGIDEEYIIESGEKTIIDRMLKQKKKKE
jgi:hypothetical protein